MEGGRAGGLLHRLWRTVWFIGYEINGVKRGDRLK
jgi:hypothetical protein